MSRLDISRFLVLGEGLAAGMTNFSLIDADQADSFPAQMARQMKVTFVQPLVQGPGIGDAPGFPRLPVRLPVDHQTTVLRQFPPSNPNANLSIPGLKLSDALDRRPIAPVVRKDSALQTAINLVLGIDGFLGGTDAPLPTQLEYALQRKPTLAVIELGFVEALEAAVAGSPTMVPETGAFRVSYSRLVRALRAVKCEVVATTVPDPVDTAHFSPLDAAARVLKVPAPMVGAVYGLQADDRVSVDGLTEMGYQLICKAPKPLPEGSILRGATAAQISRRVDALNSEIAAVARESGALVYDLHALFQTVRKSGVKAGARTLTADFLGGFYSLDGYYPGKAGQALIANGILELLNGTYGTAFEPVDVAKIVQADPVAMYRLAEGPDFTPADLTPPAGGAPAQPVPQASVTAAAAQKPGMAGSSRGGTSPVTPGAGGDGPSGAQRLPLTLPPGLEQVLPLDRESSYYGDALRAVHTTVPEEVGYGLSGNLLFGGLALLDSHLSGSLRIKFSPPVNEVTHFEVTHGDGLLGEDGRLSAPQFYKLPGLMHKLVDPQDVVSSGDLNLATGAVTNLKYRLFFLNSAIFALAQVNPTLPKVPIEFPGQYGSSWARFEQRADGLLDFEFHGTTFIPMSVLGAPARFPLPFVSPTMSFASIPCDGTALHPHIHLSTMPPEGPDEGAEVPNLPVNTIQVFTGSPYNNHFGDDFSLNAPELGSRATGRSHLMGRYQVQFGERFGNSLQFSIMSLQPGGLLTTLRQSPIAQAFGKRVPDSLLGHDEFLRFRNQVYAMDQISFLDDPLDIAVGAIDLRTGKVIGHLLRRGMITTSWILAMLRLEPRTPKDTFRFRGAASFEAAGEGLTVFRYRGDLHIPFPEGFYFPASDLTNTITIGPNSALDPFLSFQAVHQPETAVLRKHGGSKQTTASNGSDFSYRYDITSGPGKSSFEFTDITKGGTFRLLSLTWVDFINTLTADIAEGDFDTIIFSGFGTWSEDAAGGPHIATVHVCSSPTRPYVSILIDGGTTKNLNTRPVNRDLTLP
jgi:hypothetical protein